jgi:hypothetical protein
MQIAVSISTVNDFNRCQKKKKLQLLEVTRLRSIAAAAAAEVPPSTVQQKRCNRLDDVDVLCIWSFSAVAIAVLVVTGNTRECS